MEVKFIVIIIIFFYPAFVIFIMKAKCLGTYDVHMF